MAGLGIPSTPSPTSASNFQATASNVAGQTGKALVSAASTVRTQFATLDTFAPERVVAGGATIGKNLIGAGGSGAKIAAAGGVASAAGAAGGIFRSLGLSALFAVPVALVTDFIEYKQGKITAQQRNTLMAADSIGYTVTGAAGTMIGAAAGSALFGPLGIVVGVGAGLGLGFAYEKFIRPLFAGKPATPAPKVTTVTPPPAPPLVLEPT